MDLDAERDRRAKLAVLIAERLLDHWGGQALDHPRQFLWMERVIEPITIEELRKPDRRNRQARARQAGMIALLIVSDPKWIKAETITAFFHRARKNLNAAMIQLGGHGDLPASQKLRDWRDYGRNFRIEHARKNQS